MDTPAANSCTSRCRMAGSSEIRARAASKVTTEARRRAGASEIRLERRRYLRRGLIGKERVRILGTDHLAQRAFRRTRELRNALDRHLPHGRLVLPEALDTAPGHCESAGVFDVNVRLQHRAVLGQVEALDHVQVFGMRRSESVDPRPLIDADRIDDERIAFIATDGFAIPGRLDVR